MRAPRLLLPVRSICGPAFLIGLVWVVSLFLQEEQAERLKWALLAALFVLWPTVLLLRLA